MPDIYALDFLYGEISGIQGELWDQAVRLEDFTNEEKHTGLPSEWLKKITMAMQLSNIASDLLADLPSEIEMRRRAVEQQENDK